MAILLARFAWDPENAEDPHWEGLRARASGRAAGRCEEWSAPGVSALAIATRERAPPALLLLPGGKMLLSDCERPCAAAELAARPQDSAAAVIVLDPRTRQVRLLRDRLGQRPLVWARIPGALLVASGEDILRAHPAVGSTFDREFLAAYFGACAPPENATAWRAIRNLAPGEALDLDATGERSSRLANVPLAEAFGWSDARATDEFAQRLRGAVQSSCADAGRIGLSLSSGLDSGAIASLLPGALASAPDKRTPLALTYGCAHVPGPDERASAVELARYCGLEHLSFDADTGGPLGCAQHPAGSPDSPFANPYRGLKHGLYGRFREAGVDVVLTGNFGDHLFCNPGLWLGDALRERRFGLIAGSYLQLGATGGPGALWRERGWRTWLRGGARAQRPLPAWLRPELAAELAGRRADEEAASADWPHPTQAAHALGSYAAYDTAGEVYFSQAYALELRHPFRDWPLVQLALSLPAYQSWRAGRGKFVQRCALAGVLPDRWRLKCKGESMRPLFEHSLMQAGRGRLDQLVDRGQTLWSGYVRADAVANALRVKPRSDSQLLLLWLLAGLGFWLEIVD